MCCDRLSLLLQRYATLFGPRSSEGRLTHAHRALHVERRASSCPRPGEMRGTAWPLPHHFVVCGEIYRT